MACAVNGDRVGGQAWTPPSPLAFSTRLLNLSAPAMPAGPSRGAGDYQNYRARYLRVEYQAVDVAGRPLPLEQTVVALTNHGLGILRIVHRTRTGTPEFWDLKAHA